MKFNWDLELDLSRMSEIAGEDPDDEKVQEVGKYVAGQIRGYAALNKRYPETAESFAEDFESVSNEDDFNGTLDRLYNFADRNKRMWVRSF